MTAMTTKTQTHEVDFFRWDRRARKWKYYVTNCATTPHEIADIANDYSRHLGAAVRAVYSHTGKIVIESNANK